MTAASEESAVGAVPQRVKRPAGLGRGLSALLGDLQTDAPINAAGQSPREGLAMLPVAQIKPHPDQPRRHFAEDALAELAASIAAKGVVQPILVRPAPDGGQGWQLVAGERRWRAAQRAGLHEIPAIVRELDEVETFTIALIENIQRQELNAIEEAEAYARLRDRLGHSQEAIGQMTGKSRSHIANLLRLLDLPEGVRTMVAEGDLAMGHARALIGLPEAEALARQVVAKGLSVRKVEALARSTRKSDRKAANGNAPLPSSNADIEALESHLGDLLGIRVRIAHESTGKGALTLGYSTLEQLDMLCQRLTGEGI